MEGQENQGLVISLSIQFWGEIFVDTGNKLR
jgi:hypothetical protein